MLRMSTQIAILIKLALICFAMAWIASPAAFADSSCGGNGQKGCGFTKKCDSGMTKYKGICRNWGRPNKKAWPAKRIGFRCGKGYAPLSGICKPCGKANGQPACELGRIPSGCGNGLITKNKVCYSCGGPNQKACPKIEFGYPCRGDYEPDGNNICRTCGGKNQKACRALKPGDQCKGSLQNFGGTCRPCGGEDERACPVLASGTVCDSGLGKFDGYCKPCGKLDQRACPAIEVGRQCEEWTTKRDGYCRPCGTVETGACRVTDKGKACQDGLQWTVSGQCKMTEKAALKAQVIADFKAMGDDTLQSLVDSAVSLRGNEGYTESLEASDDDAPPAPPGMSCPGNTHQSYTVGIVGGAQLGIGVSGEVGAAFRCVSTPGFGNDSKWYSGGAVSYGLQANAEAGVTLGMWESEVNQLRGKVHGWTFDLLDLVTLGSKGNIKIPSTEVKGVPVKPSIVVGLWYARKDTDMDGGSNWDFDYQGMTLTVTGVIGEGIGPEYVRATTNQVCDYEMGCAIGDWYEVNDDDARVAGGLAITVKERTPDFIKVDIFENGTPRYDVEFVRDTALDKRDYKKLSDDDDDVEERICFRKNFRELKYMGEDRNCDRGLTLIMPGIDKDDDDPQYDDGTITSDSTSRSTRSRSDNPTAPFSRRQTSGSSDVSLAVDGRWEMKTPAGAVGYTIKRGNGLILMRSEASGKAIVYRKISDKVYRSDAGAQLTFANARAGIWQSASGARYVVQMR
ncbi:MAG: hypothetical protein HRT81_08510 [Henriciella sp.]|nr:hypothetical protein [Henriciella sp.]